MQLRLCMYTHVRSFRKWCHGAVRKFFFSSFSFSVQKSGASGSFRSEISRGRNRVTNEILLILLMYGGWKRFVFDYDCYSDSQKFVYLQFKLIYIYYNFGYIVKFHLVGFCRKCFVVESFDRSRVRVWMQSWKFFVTGRIDVVGVFFLPPEMQEQPGVPVFRQARENFTSNSKQRGQYLLCSK